MVDKIKHIFIVLVLPTKSVFKHKKTCRRQHTYIIMGPLCSWDPACICIKTALVVATSFQRWSDVFFSFWEIYYRWRI